MAASSVQHSLWMYYNRPRPMALASSGSLAGDFILTITASTLPTAKPCSTRATPSSPSSMVPNPDSPSLRSRKTCIERFAGSAIMRPIIPCGPTVSASPVPAPEAICRSPWEPKVTTATRRPKIRSTERAVVCKPWPAFSRPPTLKTGEPRATPRSASARWDDNSTEPSAALPTPWKAASNTAAPSPRSTLSPRAWPPRW